MNTKYKTWALTILFLGFIFFAQNIRANGTAFYWSAAEIDTQNTKACLEFGVKVLRTLEFSDVKLSGQSATGDKGNTSATIPCLKTTNGVSAVIMVVGKSGAPVQYLHDQIKQKFAGFPAIPAPLPSSSDSLRIKPSVKPSVNSSVYSKSIVSPNPYFFWWDVVSVKTKSPSRCEELAKGILAARVPTLEPSGTKNSRIPYVGAMCFQNGQQVYALVASTGIDNANTQNAVDALTRDLARVNDN